ncbi:uncharacterized protein LOC109797921 [Cajanus cajan]|uniref:Chaperone protein dnaJ n=1 Tax=Cajanus cajan TaxID=3821 RepID=A0A151TSZ1_CAJCA|nr:uncharacterized protein LOC109797921 [Cajanus cajan]KYP70157.1 hypothetical protein KK1_009368 [Cajanus cajan]
MSLTFAFAFAFAFAPSLHLPSISTLRLRQWHSPSVFVKTQAKLVDADSDAGILCEPCNGRGWLVCDFCKGQKTNVKAENNKRIYRRCPSCKAVGYVLCSNCKVFKCLTFPDFNDSTN